MLYHHIGSSRKYKIAVITLKKVSKNLKKYIPFSSPAQNTFSHQNRSKNIDTVTIKNNRYFTVTVFAPKSPIWVKLIFVKLFVMSLFLAKETREGPFGAQSGSRSGNLVVRGLQDLQLGRAMASLATPNPGDLLWWAWALPECPLRPPLYVVLIRDAKFHYHATGMPVFFHYWR